MIMDIILPIIHGIVHIVSGIIHPITIIIILIMDTAVIMVGPVTDMEAAVFTAIIMQFRTTGVHTQQEESQTGQALLVTER